MNLKKTLKKGVLLIIECGASPTLIILHLGKGPIKELLDVVLPDGDDEK